MNDELLIRLFQRHFADPVAALRRLDIHLATIQLPFDFKAQLRELHFPPQPSLPGGLPSFIYYFVPDSQRGTDKLKSEDPFHPSFLNAADGIGLNLGCLFETGAGFQVIRFPTPENGLASPVFRSTPGFIGGGQTAGGASEFVIPNGPIPSGATTTIVH